MKQKFLATWKKGLLPLSLTAMALTSPFVSADQLDEIRERGYMTVAIDPTFAPYEFLSDKGEISGYSPRIMAAVGERLGVEIRYQKMAFSGIIPGLIAGSFDAEASTLNITPERAARVDFTTPYGRTVNGVMVRKGESLTDGELTIADLAGKTAAVKSSSTPESILKGFNETLEQEGLDPITLLTLDTVDQTLSTLMTRRADFLFDDVSVLAEIESQHGDRVDSEGELGPAQWMAWATRPADTSLNDVMSVTILDLQASGQLQAWQQEFLGTTFDVPTEDVLPDSQ